MEPITHQTDSGFLLPLRSVTRDDVDQVGGKAANLGELLHEGFPVPDGAVVTVDAFAAFAREHGLPEHPTPESVLSAPLPHSIGRRLLDALPENPGDTWAVRSSATSEDLPDASFAGQYETVLSVSGRESIEAALKQCWASAFASHVDRYRSLRADGETAMAVLVQRMVSADAAGVAFSANPVTGSRDEVVVNSVRGLGDRLVSGRASPDEWVVADGQARCERNPEQAIDAELAIAIADLTRRVEAHYGTPQDIEWAVDASGLHLLQARPITTLAVPAVDPVPIPVEVPPGFWFYDVSHAPKPNVPFDRVFLPFVISCSAHWFEQFGHLLDHLEFREIGGWAYQRMVPLGNREGPSLPTWVMRMLVRVVPQLRRRVARARDAVRSDLAGTYVRRWYDQWQPELATRIAEMRDRDLRTLSDTELDEHLASTVDLLGDGVQIHMLLHGSIGPLLYEFVTSCERLLGWDVARAMSLVSGTSYKSTEPARRLAALASAAVADSSVRTLLQQGGDPAFARIAETSPAFAAAVDEYLQEYGCRALGHITVAEPTLAERPALVLSMISGQIETGFDPDRNDEAGTVMRAQAVEEAERALANRPDDLAEFHRVLTRATDAYPVREDNEFYTMSAPLALVRYGALEVGRRLHERGRIEEAADVVFLERDEAVDALGEKRDLREIVLHRKGQRAWAERNPGPPSYGTPPPGPPSLEFLPEDARLPMESLLWSNEVIMAVGATGAADERELRGVAASAGRYTGPVRVVMDESEFEKARPGDVLVCPITAPVWSVLFPIIGALVTDTGGILSHPAIIAREYQVPAVVATGSATAELSDGEIVTVDGSSGVVHRESGGQKNRSGLDHASVGGGD